MDAVSVKNGGFRVPKIRRSDEAIKGGRRGKPVKTPKDFKQAAAQQWWEYAWRGITGQPVNMGGSTGKCIKKPLSEQSQIRLWETIGRKLTPDLSAQAVKAEVETVTRDSDVDDGMLRNFSRAALHDATERAAKGDPEAATFLELVKAKREAMEKEAARQQAECPSPPPHGQLLLGRDDVIEVSAGQPEAAPSAPVGLHGDERKDNRAVMPSSGPKVVRRMPRRIR